MTVTNKSYDFAFTHSTIPARRDACTTLHMRWTAARTFCVLQTCFSRTACTIETGPHKHAIQQTFFLYVYEPGGNRVEVCNAGARLDPCASIGAPITWTET